MPNDFDGGESSRFSLLLDLDVLTRMRRETGKCLTNTRGKNNNNKMMRSDGISLEIKIFLTGLIVDFFGFQLFEAKFYR